MIAINIKKEVNGRMDEIVDRLTKKLGENGFGILTRIDFHTKIKEKLGKNIPPTVILGACNPSLAYEAYLKNADVTSLVPCNAVVREIGKEKFSVELTKPTVLMAILGNEDLEQLAGAADANLAKVLDEL